MKIAYVANVRMPTEKAHGIQIMKMCEAWARDGHEVHLIVPLTKMVKRQDPFAYYGVDKTFGVVYIKTPYLLFLKSVGYLLQTAIFSELASWKIRGLKPDVVYGRDEALLFNYVLIFRNLFWESHRGARGFVARTVVKRARGLVVISGGLKKLYERFASPAKILVAHDGVDLAKFDIPTSQTEARQKLGLPAGQKIVMYCGHLYEWKGVTVLKEAAKTLSGNADVYFVGGTAHEIDAFKKDSPSNVHVLGQKSHAEIPLYLKAADVLVIPNSAKNEMSSLYTSPLKLFEYMASGTPIVASDLASLHDVIDEKSAYFAAPDSASSLAEKIGEVLGDPEGAKRKAEAAKEASAAYTWQKRARLIADFFKSSLEKK